MVEITGSKENEPGEKKHEIQTASSKAIMLLGICLDYARDEGSLLVETPNGTGRVTEIETRPAADGKRLLYIFKVKRYQMKGRYENYE